MIHKRAPQKDEARRSGWWWRVARRGVETRLFIAAQTTAGSAGTVESKDGDTMPQRRRRRHESADDALALRWEVCAHRIVTGLEQMTRAERDQRPLDAQMVAKKCLRKNLSPL